MSELGQLETYYRIVYDYLQPDRLLSCVEGVLLSVAGGGSTGGHHQNEDNYEEDEDLTQSLGGGGGSSYTSGQPLWCVVSTVQSRVLLALIIYFSLCIFFIHIAWLVYGQHINDLFVRSGIGQPQQNPQVNHGANPTESSSPKRHSKAD